MNGFENLLHVYDFIRPFLDIGVMAFILYKAYEIIVKTNALQIIKAAIVVAMAYAVALLLHLSMLLWVLQKLAPGLVVCFALFYKSACGQDKNWTEPVVHFWKPFKAYLCRYRNHSCRNAFKNEERHARSFYTPYKN